MDTFKIQISKSQDLTFTLDSNCMRRQEGTPTNILLVAADVAIHTDSHDGSLQSTPHAQSLPIHNAKSTPSTVGGRDAVSTLCFIVTGLWASSTLSSRSNVTTFSKRTPQGEVGWGHALKIKSQCEGIKKVMDHSLHKRSRLN